MNVAFVGAAHELGPPVAAADRRAEDRGRRVRGDRAAAPPKNWVTSGVRNENRWVDRDREDVAGARATRSGAHAIVVAGRCLADGAAIGSRAPSPWVCEFFSWTARACIPAVSVGWTAP